MKEPVRVWRDVVLAYHERLLAEHGGSAGIRKHHKLDKAQLRFLNTDQLRGVELVDNRDDFWASAANPPPTNRRGRSISGSTTCARTSTSPSRKTRSSAPTSTTSWPASPRRTARSARKANAAKPSPAKSCPKACGWAFLRSKAGASIFWNCANENS